jgi:hypothetical protein
VPGSVGWVRPSRPAAGETGVVVTPGWRPSPAVTPKIDPSAVPGDGVPARDQAVWLQATTTAGYPLLTALPGGALAATEEGGATDDALFALVPISPGAREYVLKTGTLGSSGEPGCVERDGDGFALTTCDVSHRGRRNAHRYLLIIGTPLPVAPIRRGGVA